MFFVLIFNVPSCAELTVDSFCNLAIDSMKQEIANLNESIAFVQQFSGNKEAFLEQEGIKKQETDAEKVSLFGSFNTTAEEYVTFAGKNEKAVKDYLNVRPDIKQEIESLSQQVNALLDEYESLKQGIIKKPFVN